MDLYFRGVAGELCLSDSNRIETMGAILEIVA